MLIGPLIAVRRQATFLLPCSPPGTAVALAPSELVGVAKTGRAPVGDAIANHTVFDLTSPAVSNAVALMSALGSRSFPRSRSASC
jgi:hypothetical protein